MNTVSILWRRLDAPGHDACRLEDLASGRVLEGCSVYLHEAAAACLTYRIELDAAWRSTAGRVAGWIGSRRVSAMIERAGSVWTINGKYAAGLESLVDLDLGFTPSTNLAQLRRLALEEGQAADAPVAWFDASTATLSAIHQRYERRAGGVYWYESPSFGYSALLEVDAAGFVRRYPGLWDAEPVAPHRGEFRK